jgi:RHS repeat-associated protein
MFPLLSRRNARRQLQQFSNFTWYTYDSFGDLTEVEDPLDNLTANSYDTAGRLTQTTDPLMNTTVYQYDNLDHVTQRSVPGAAASPSITTYGYDNVYNMTSMVDPNNHSWTWKYGDRNRLAKVCDPNSNCTQFTYDNNSNVTQFSNASGTTDVFIYDKINRKVTEKWAYNSTTGTTGIKDAYTYDLGNRMTQVVDSVAGTTTRTYDGQDRILTDQQASNGTITYQYDLDERRTTMSGAGPSVSYGYDNNGNLTSEYNSYFGTVQIVVDLDNRRSSVQLPNSVTEAYSYDQDSHLTTITYTNGNDTQIGNLGYSYDADGRRTEVTGSFASLVLPNFGGNNSQSFAYNKDGSSTATTNDDDGDVTIDLGVSYQYNGRAQVKQIANLSSPVFAENLTYDPFGRRVSNSLSLNGGSPLVTNYLYDGSNIAKESSVGAAYVMTGLAPDDRFARYSSGVYQYYLTDAVGSVVALTDQNGVVQTQYTYGPFGQTTSTGTASDNPYQFAGRELDPNGGNGIYYFRARYYDSLELNRFMERDPQGLSGGNYATLYAYVGNSPLNGTDPTGQFFLGPAGLGWDGTWNGLDIDFENSISEAADAQAIATGNVKNFNSDQGGSQGNTLSSYTNSAGAVIRTSWSWQWAIYNEAGQLMLPPGFGIGVTRSETFAYALGDTPIFEIDASPDELGGKFGGFSGDITFGLSPSSSLPEIMGVQGTIGVGLVAGSVSVTVPSIHVTSPSP